MVLKKLGIEESEFNYEGFAKFIAGGRSLNPMCKRFYVGTVREREGDEQSKKAMAKQTALFARLKNTKWEIKTSKLKVRTEEIVIDKRVVDYQKLLKLGVKSIKFERMREKGVDVMLATDLIVGAVDNQYDTAVVVSSDSDLIPAIDWVRHRKNKKVEYVGFSIPNDADPKRSTNPLISLITKTDIKRILVESDLRAFVR